MIVTDDPEVAAICRSLRNQGRRESVPVDVESGDSGTVSPDEEFDRLWLRHERLGYNYRLDELSAALGVAQMSRIDEIIAGRERVARLYDSCLRAVPGLRLPWIDPDVTRMSWFVFAVQVGQLEDADAQAAERNAVMRRLNRDGVQCRPYFTPIHLQPFYREAFGYTGGEYPVAERLGRTSVAIPFHARLTAKEAAYVAEAFEGAFSSVAAGGERT